jgi:hypothetical protein
MYTYIYVYVYIYIYIHIYVCVCVYVAQVSHHSPCQDFFAAAMARSLPLLAVLAFIYSVSNIVKRWDEFAAHCVVLLLARMVQMSLVIVCCLPSLTCAVWCTRRSCASRRP